ncbi:putative DNA (cytosine-5)-methyltransferase 1 isoform X1 [Iris pallida]|uniref:DNA (Cytosine-5)-methyltransferase 1 isoform X1 n=1 Tax=Iris pallida TaxID=29817 RepID=A0AAX6DVC1_IRIPA|nr:putative DNA (cytosine-5)-methyltransferase 1 isoform X1 [Iris pallida]
MAGTSTPRTTRPPKPSPSSAGSGSRTLRSGSRLPDPAAAAAANADPDPTKNPGILRRSPRVSTTTEGSGERSVYVDPEDSDSEKRPSKKKKNASKSSSKKTAAEESADLERSGNASGKVNGNTFFVGEAVPEEKARARWPHRYKRKGKMCNDWNSIANVEDDDDIFLKVKCHYLQANVSGSILNIGDCAYVKGEQRKPNYIGRILEFFETIKGEYYVRVQWFYKAVDTVMKEQADCHDKKRLFYSDLANDNLLDCIISKVRVVQIPPSLESKSKSLPSCYYYDMKYSVEYSTFQIMESDDSVEKSDLSSSDCSGTDYSNDAKREASINPVRNNSGSTKSELALLDLFSGCGGMSTGLCLGAKVAGVKLVTAKMGC